MKDLEDPVPAWLEASLADFASSIQRTLGVSMKETLQELLRQNVYVESESPGVQGEQCGSSSY